MDSNYIINLAKQAWAKLAYMNGKTDFTIKFANSDIFLAHTDILKELQYFKTIISDTKCEHLDFNIGGTKTFTKRVFTFLYERLVREFSKPTRYDCLSSLDNAVEQMEYIKMLDYLTDPVERPGLTRYIIFEKMFWVGMVVNNVANVKTFFDDYQLCQGFESFLDRIYLNHSDLENNKQELFSIALYFGIDFSNANTTHIPMSFTRANYILSCSYNWKRVSDM